MASIIGTVLFVAVLMAGIGAVVYMGSLQAQSNQASQRAEQLLAQRARESLTYQLQGGALSTANAGPWASTVRDVILKFANGSVYQLSASVSIPASATVGVAGMIPAGSCGLSTCLSKYNTLLASETPGDSIGLTTSLGNVFWYSNAAAPTSSMPSQNLSPGSSWTTFTDIGANDMEAQVYQSPFDPTRFYLTEGSSIFSFSVSTLTTTWSFNAGGGQIADVLPLSNGYVYIEDAYFTTSSTPYSPAVVMELSPSGTLLNSYTMRSARGDTWLEVQYPDNDAPPYPLGSLPVQKVADSLYAVYDGWFMGSSGMVTSPYFGGDTYNIATTDSSQIYLVTFGTNPGGFGCTNPRGSGVSISAWKADSGGVAGSQWSTYVYFNNCNFYPASIVSATTGPGVVAILFGQTYYSQPNYYGGGYAGQNPYLVVLSTSGSVLFSNYLDRPAYTSIATDGIYVYLGVLGTSQFERVSISGGATSTYTTSLAPASLSFSKGELFVSGNNGFQVFNSEMSSVQTVQFGTNAELYSYGNPFSLESGLHQPSFLVLNSTYYAALVRNPVSGLGTLEIARHG